ncbi:hypothetical protein AB4Y36_01505 [Paraburkholderia sp. BR10936]|uniref:hypothetical protein n=1 Tax=Paraburkholderia sp. BR10936 TaxID=3236993 RepID=UPI0034D234C8
MKAAESATSMLEIDLDHPAFAGMTAAETYVLVTMAMQMDREGRVCGVPARLATSTYYRVLKRLVARGLAEKVGGSWRVVPEFARRTQST